MASLVKSFARFCVSDGEKRRISIFLLLNMIFTVVEVFYGWISHSLGLVGDGMHMFFDSSVILANLIVMFIGSRSANENFTFGYGRSEAMAGFINALLLIYSAVTILIGALERIVHPHFEIHSEHLLSVSVMGLLVNLCGLLAFGHDHCHQQHSSKVHPAGEQHSSSKHGDCASKSCCSASKAKPQNYIKEGMFMHVAVDALGSVAVIVSSLVIQMTGWIHADTLCSVLLALMILWAVRPLLFDTFHVLLNGTPKQLAGRLLDVKHDLSLLLGKGFCLAGLKIWEHSSKEVYAVVSGSCIPGLDLEACRLQIVSLLMQKMDLKQQFIFVELFHVQ